MARKTARSFRLSDETQKQLVLIATELGIRNQTEALEVAVQDYYFRLKSGEPIEPSAAEEMEIRAFGPDEALARHWDGVADSFDGDDTLRPKLREAVSRAARGTAKNLRKEK